LFTLRILYGKMIVMKFGGTSVGSAKNIRAVADIIEKKDGRKIVVVSAMSGVTDSLSKIAHRIIDLPNSVIKNEANQFIKQITDKHTSTAKELIHDERILKRSLSKIDELSEKLETVLLGVGFLEDLSPKSMDYILSFGERLSITITSSVLESKKIKAKALTGYEAGIVTDSNFGRAHPIHNILAKSIKENINSLTEEGIIPVVAGFIAANSEGTITTLGRGGSDYTASLLGRYLKASEVQIWTDVDGILTADPKIVPEARLIPTLSYIEAVDLAYFGAKVIHSKMIEPAMDVNIPVRIKNTFNPQGEGTLIVSKQEKIDHVIKAVTAQQDVGIVNLKGVGMIETPNISGKLFSLLGGKNINILMISGSSESNLSFVIKKSLVDDAVETISAGFGDNSIRSLEVVEDVCIITVVGVGMQGAKGLAARVFQAVADVDVNIIMIAQGSSEVNISFIVDEVDREKVVKTLHKMFIEDVG